MAAKDEQVFGIPWYSRETYDEVVQAMEDRASLPDSYAYWLSSAESVETALQATGKRAVRVELDVPSFLAWCREQAVPPNARARSRYAAEVVSRRAEGAGEG